MKPIEYAEKIYQFVGLAMTDRMKRWIFSNTQVRVGQRLYR